MKLTLITDPSEALIGYKRDNLISQWGLNPIVQYVSRIQGAGEMSLFGDAPVSVLDIDSADKLREFVEYLKNTSQETLASKSQFGLIITSSLAVNVLSPLRKACEAAGIQMLTNLNSQGKVKDPTLVASELIDSLHLNRDVKEFLLDYVGPDYETLLPIVRNVQSTSIQGQAKITIPDMQVRLPKDRASSVPWEIDGCLTRGDLLGALDALRRFPPSQYLIVLSVMKKKFLTAYRCSAVMESNPRITKTELSDAIKTPNTFALQKSMELAKQLGSQRLQKISEVLTDTENKMKGLLSGYPHVTMEMAILAVYDQLRK